MIKKVNKNKKIYYFLINKLYLFQKLKYINLKYFIIKSCSKNLYLLIIIF